MASGFLKTVSFGGFDKKDVLTYVDELNTKIYKLESELEEKINALDRAGGSYTSFDGADEYEKTLAEERAKQKELHASIDTLNFQVANLESENSELKAEIENLKTDNRKLKEDNEDLNQKVNSQDDSTSMNASFDIGSVFIEAKHSADRIIDEAKKAARKTESDSKELAQQVLDDANTNAEKILSNSQNEAQRLISSAKSESAYILEQAKIDSENISESSNLIRREMLSDFEQLSENVENLTITLSSVIRDSVTKLSEAKEIIDITKDSIKSGENLEGVLSQMQSKNETQDTFLGDGEIELENEIVEQPEFTPEVEAAAEEPISEEDSHNQGVSQSNNFGIDSDFLADMAKAVEADAENNDEDEILSGWNT